MILVVAEKPALARDIADALLGRYEEKGGVMRNDKYTIVSVFGHLLELADPKEYDPKYEDRWNEKILPIYFSNWKKVPDPEKKGRLDLIGKLLNNCTEVVHAGDPDEEGQLLIDEILEHFNYKGKVSRVLVTDNIKEKIIKEFSSLKSNDEFYGMGRAAYSRQMADIAFGINESRLACIRLNTPGLTVGRVQSATLGLVVNRDREIELHKRQEYYELYMYLNLQSKDYQYTDVKTKFKFLEGEYKDELVLDVEVYKELASGLKDYSGEVIVSSKKRNNFARLPFNLTKLQSEMNKKYGYPIQKTLNITQSLRDKYKAITYNRSDSQYLSEEFFNEAPVVLSVALRNIAINLPLDFSIKAKCFNSSKVSAHHAIIPQNKQLDLNKMSEEEQNVYKAIVERYAMQFLPPEVIEEVEAKIPYKNGEFSYKGKRVIDKGYRAFVNNDSEEDLSTFIVPGSYSYMSNKLEAQKKETEPQKRYTQDTLNRDMSNIAKYVSDERLRAALKEKDKDKEDEHGSIGTVATRGEILEKLFQRKFLEMKGKSVVSTTLGREFYGLLPDEIKKAELTAIWWLLQEDIREGKRDVNELQKAVVDSFNSRKETAYLNKTIKSTTVQKKSVGKCPKCKSNVLEGPTTWYCEQFSKTGDGCDFRLFENIKYFDNNLKLTTNKVTQLLAGKTVKFKIKKRNNEKYSADFKLEENGKYFNLKKV